MSRRKCETSACAEYTEIAQLRQMWYCPDQGTESAGNIVAKFAKGGKVITTENEASSAGLNLLLVAVVCQAVKDAKHDYRAVRWLRDEGLDGLETLDCETGGGG